MFTWSEYNAPEVVGALAEKDLGVTITLDFYGSNEDLITHLSTSGGASGFDVIVPTGPYVPQMITKNLIQRLDKSKLPNALNLDPLYVGRAWDPSNDYTVCKDWGSTGWMYDTTKIKSDVNTWADFIRVCQTEASGNCSILDTAPNLAGMYFWANGIDWTTERTADLDACENFLVNDFAKHIKAFDSYPSSKIAEGTFAIAMVWNGDARFAFSRLEEAGGDPSRWKWVLGAPATELWMDNYAIATGAGNPDAAHAWINWALTPEVSMKDLNWHGYHTGMKHMPELIKQLLPNLVRREMVFFSDAQVATMHTSAVNSAQDRLVDILAKVKAKAGA